MYDKRSDECELDYAARMLRELALPSVPGESVKAVLWRLNRKLPTLSAARIKSIWYRDHRVKLSAEEAQSIMRALNKTEAKDELRAEIEGLRAEIAELRKHLLAQTENMSCASFEPNGAALKPAR